MEEQLRSTHKYWKTKLEELSRGGPIQEYCHWAPLSIMPAIEKARRHKVALECKMHDYTANELTRDRIWEEWQGAVKKLKDFEAFKEDVDKILTHWLPYSFWKYQQHRQAIGIVCGTLYEFTPGQKQYLLKEHGWPFDEESRIGSEYVNWRESEEARVLS